jgi:hypothetical protein
MTVRNARDRDEIERAQMFDDGADADLRWVLSDPRGRRFLWDTMGRFKLNEQTYSPNNSEHCFNAGIRNAAIVLLHDVLRVSPQNYLLAQEEAIARAEREKQRVSTDEGDSP